MIEDPAVLESVEPGWEYYLDRLVAAETGGDPSAIDFDRDYYPALSSYYAGLRPAIAGQSPPEWAGRAARVRQCRPVLRVAVLVTA